MTKSGNRARALVVEDDADFRELLTIYLSGAGYDVATATDGIDALSSMYASVPRLVLVDLMMPRMNGLELIDQIRTDRAFAGVRVIAMSAAHALLPRAEASRADVVLRKPFDPDVLASLASLEPAPRADVMPSAAPARERRASR